MAPFGKTFLKARMKNRAKDAEPVLGKEIQVSVCDEDKVVCGVTKHTTCADMVQALLEDHKTLPESKRLLSGDAKDFCLVERWKGFERALPPLTRILRLWNAWGDQRPFIRFVLVKSGDFVPQSLRKGANPKGAKPKRCERGPAQHDQPSRVLPAERQKRMVKKAFRKLEKLHKESRCSPGAEEIERMVQLILSQDHTLQEQAARMGELDAEIQRFELHALRRGADAEGLPSQPRGQTGLGRHAEEEEEEEKEEQLQEYLYASDGLEQLEQQVQEHQKLILKLSRDIDAELTTPSSSSSSSSSDAREEGVAAATPWLPPETDAQAYAPELERLRSELKRSLVTGVRLHARTAALDKELQSYDSAMLSRDQECWRLAALLSKPQVEVNAEERGGAAGATSAQVECGVQAQAVALKRSLFPADVTDTDSDTGISSTHSQDSLSPCLDFPPPLDTDV